MIRTEPHKGGGTAFFANNERFCIMTEATDPAAVSKFKEICDHNGIELYNLTEAAAERRRWNSSNPGKGRDWPIFRQLERLITRLMKEAGIKDT